MNRIVMIKTPDGYEGIYFLADHRTMDAQSLICFLRDVIELYCSQKYEGVPGTEGDGVLVGAAEKRPGL